MIINVVHNVYGQDKPGDLDELHGLTIAREMQLFDGDAGVMSKRVHHTNNFTA